MAWELLFSALSLHSGNKTPRTRWYQLPGFSTKKGRIFVLRCLEVVNTTKKFEIFLGSVKKSFVIQPFWEMNKLKNSVRVMVCVRVTRVRRCTCNGHLIVVTDKLVYQKDSLLCYIRRRYWVKNVYSQYENIDNGQKCADFEKQDWLSLVPVFHTRESILRPFVFDPFVSIYKFSTLTGFLIDGQFDGSVNPFLFGARSLARRTANPSFAFLLP